jgi:hypothetical protein
MRAASRPPVDMPALVGAYPEKIEGVACGDERGRRGQGKREDGPVFRNLGRLKRYQNMGFPHFGTAPFETFSIRM